MRDLCAVRGPELLVQLDDDPEANDGVLLVLDLQQLEGQREDGLGVGLQEVVGGQTLDHLKDELADLKLRSTSVET